MAGGGSTLQSKISAMKKTAFTPVAARRIGYDLALPSSPGSTSSSTELKTRQSIKIRELASALARAGFTGLDEQAEVLGLSRSTTWAVLRGNHKCSGLSAGVIRRMLSSPQLPPSVRKTILEYIEEKAAGCYGHSSERLRKFVGQLQRSSSNANAGAARDLVVS
jgi:hypothetical protein